MSNAQSVTVFTGLSLSSKLVKKAIPEARVLPPIARGQLLEQFELGHTRFLIVDGEFDANLAVSPSEVTEVLSRGAFVAGSSSMGALRAAELVGEGMVGIGEVFEYICASAAFRDDWLGQLFVPETGECISVPFIETALYLRRQNVELTPPQLDSLPHFSQLTLPGHEAWIDSCLGGRKVASGLKAHIRALFRNRVQSQKLKDGLQLLKFYRARKLALLGAQRNLNLVSK